MPAPLHHKERVRKDLMREIGWTIANRLRDPRIPPIVTVLDVKLGDDTRNATVCVSMYGEDVEKDEAVAALNHAAPAIQKMVSERVSVKHFPKLYFKLDKLLDQGQRINELLNEIKDDLV